MSGLFGSSTPTPPPIAAPAPMPDAQSPSVLEAQRQAAAATMQRAGRTSTILGKQGGPAGPSQAPRALADSYAGSKLGAQ